MVLSLLVLVGLVVLLRLQLPLLSADLVYLLV
jgi:hypothetical protein